VCGINSEQVRANLRVYICLLRLKFVSVIICLCQKQSPFYVENAMAEPMISRLAICGPDALQQYVMEMLDGILDFEIAQPNKWSYTYHDRMVNNHGVNQLEYVKEELERAWYTRRAIISFRDSLVDTKVGDPACLQHMQFFIRDEKLHLKVVMRSNDATEATFMNAFAFIMLQKRLADMLGIEVGSYTHRANSFHCYEKDFALLEGYVHGLEVRPLEMLTYDYEGDWKEIMEDSIPQINEMVENQRSKLV